MKRIAIIPARGGSKRIPKKNIKPFCGKPVIAYSIEAALSSGLFSTVMVSTDSEEIADVARTYGAQVPFMRSAESANDTATTADVIREVLDTYRDKGEVFDIYCCLYATAPFVTGARLNEACILMSEKKADAVLAVTRFDFPPQRGLLMTGEGCAHYWFPEHENTRSQDLAPVYHDAGQFYFGRTEAFYEQHTLIMKKTCPVILSAGEAQDIDTPTDWEIAEEKFLRIRSKTGEQAHV